MDFALDDDLDLMIVDGDLAIVADDKPQRAGLILRTYSGNWKQWPKTGLGRASFINSPIDGHLKRSVAMQLEADGLSADATYLPNALDIVLR